jgi:hypothetical protein
MKPTLITPIFLALALPLFSQTWLAEGQTWEYDVTGGWNPTMYGKLVMQVQGDSTLEGINCKRIVSMEPNGQTGVQYAYADQERVFVFDAFLDSFVKIYDFTLSAGDTVFFLGGRKYVVDSVGITTFADALRKFQIVRLSGNSLDAGTYLIAEGIGLVSRFETFNPIYDCIYFFLENSFCDEAVDGRSYRFRCFTEGGSTYDPFGLCTLSSVEGLHSQKLKIFPNPAQSQFTIQLEGNPSEYGLLQVFDATGRMILETPKTLPATVSVEGWPAGNYQVLFFGEKVTVRGQVVVP